MDPYIGEIRSVGFNFEARGWAFCDGRLLPISQNTALFSLLGTTFGGNGQTNFGLPNLRGMVAVGQGQGPGQTNREMGEVNGAAQVTISTPNLPPHSHNVVASSPSATSTIPTGNFPAKAGRNCYASASTGNLSVNSVIVDGGGQPHNNMQPFCTINYIIALQGIFPPRS